MLKRFLLALASLLCVSASFAQTVGPPQVVSFAFNYNHITSDSTTLVKASTGLLGNVCINGTASGEVITIYDSLTPSGQAIAVITEGSTTQGCFYYNVVFKTGLTIVTTVAAGDLTILFQ
jgi:hypothetical protein